MAGEKKAMDVSWRSLLGSGWLRNRKDDAADLLAQANAAAAPAQPHAPVSPAKSSGSELFITDLITALQDSLDVAHDASLRRHRFAVVKFDITATFRFALNEKAALQENASSAADAAETSGPRRLISLFSQRRDKSTSQQSAAFDSQSRNAVEDDGAITLHLEFLPKALASKHFAKENSFPATSDAVPDQANSSQADAPTPPPNPFRASPIVNPGPPSD
ncbi:hypothetical protein JHL17_36035 [Azospirillum sp. YIM B02556]|uniref:DNA polymerase Y-family little finger domain-containing protein n=1 Tax=Azospirillum endophyticum TaxID=2800326 RepID=A0ABS1FHE4_9PROT|nr:hypothetical protein [Azospirillum endophyticum]MBK1842817.1 hypothetical protein [Azospirillum endophyticum]